MIGSIFRKFGQVQDQHTVETPQDLSKGAISRSAFLSIMAVGLTATGVAAMSRKASAAPAHGDLAVRDLDKFYDAWQDRFNAWDADAMADLYVEDVTYLNPQGHRVMGRAAVRQDLANLFQLKPKIQLNERRYILHSDTALTTNHWAMTLTGPDGAAQNMTGGGIEVVRKQSDGDWRFIIDDASRSAR
jgi:uncharacterized protein (TIGR02246 family)